MAPALGAKMADRLLRAGEVAEILSIPAFSVYQLARDGDLRFAAVRIGERRLRFRSDLLESYIAAGGRSPDDEPAGAA